jgi:hypothetical protein
MSYNNDTKIARPSGSNNVNDPTYPGPTGRMFIFKKNITLYLATTRLPKSVYDHVDFASDVFDLPPSNKSIEAMVIATPKKEKYPKIEGQYFVRTRSGKEVKKLLFTKQGELLLDATLRVRQGRAVQASMHKKLAMEQQIGHKLTSRDSGYQRLLDKAIDEQVEKEAKRLEQLAASEKPSDVLQDAADDGDAGASGPPCVQRYAFSRLRGLALILHG